MRFLITFNKTIHSVFDGLTVLLNLSILRYSYDFFKVFGVFWGYLINKIIISLIGFFGMYFLLKKHFISEK